MDLTERETGRILAWLEDGLSVREIARRVKRDPKTIQRVREDPNFVSKRENCGRKSKVSDRQMRAVVRTASNTGGFTRTVRYLMNLYVSVRTVRRVLHRSELLEYIKADTQHEMTQSHEEQRVEWADKHVTWDEARWAEIMYSDEKTFNRDGPDNFAFY